MPPGGIRTHDLSRRGTADQRLRQRGHWDRLLYLDSVGKYGSAGQATDGNIKMPLRFAS